MIEAAGLTIIRLKPIFFAVTNLTMVDKYIHSHKRFTHDITLKICGCGYNENVDDPYNTLDPHTPP